MTTLASHRQSSVDNGQAKLPVVFLMGPTASGKTDLALALARRIPLEIISVDSTQVYRGLDIGAAKPSAAELAQVRHHLIDIRDPAEPYSAAEFRQDALAAIEAIHSRGAVPLLAGGTMLYFKVLLEGLAELPAADPQVRAAIEAEAEQRGWPALHEELAAVDPALAAQLHPNHSQRIARALEVYRVSGITMSEHRARQHQNREPGFADQFALTQLAMTPRQRSTLHQRIEKRFHAMLAAGFEAEVIQLWQRGDLHTDLPAIRAVGYRQMWDYLSGEYDFDTMVERGIAATRQLAKRQLTWLRRWPDIHWLYTDNEAGVARKIEEIVDETLNYFRPSPI